MTAAVKGRSAMALYSNDRSIHCHRVRFVLAEKSINVDIISVNKNESAAADLAELNPYNETPTLVDRDLLLHNASVINDYLDEVSASLNLLCKSNVKQLPPMRKRRFLKRAARSFGRSALLLSGGASLGLFHIGVIDELETQGLLPRVVTGSSAGSIMAGILATHTDTELEALQAVVIAMEEFTDLKPPTVSVEVRRLWKVADNANDELYRKNT